MAQRSLPTIRIRQWVVPADKVTPKLVKAWAAAANKMNAKAALSNGLRISPDGTVDHFPPRNTDDDSAP